MSIHDNLTNNVYRNKLGYPQEPPKSAYMTMTPEGDELFKRSSYEADLAKFRDLVRDYKAEDARLIEQFKQDALDDLGIANHPKANILWEKAWDWGRGDGLYQVWNCLLDLVDLL